MAIDPNKYYPKQMNGPVISAFGSAVNSHFSVPEQIMNYLHGLSISTAQETELENIGRLIGYPRPLVPEGFNSENLMIIGSLPLTHDEENGLAAAGTEVGGELSTVTESDTNFMSIETYRQFLSKMANLKRYGITLNSVSKIASVVSTNFTISWTTNKDISVHYTEDIGYKNIWILTQLFYKIATAPQVIISAGDDDEEEEE